MGGGKAGSGVCGEWVSGGCLKGWGGRGGNLGLGGGGEKVMEGWGMGWGWSFHGWVFSNGFLKTGYGAESNRYVHLEHGIIAFEVRGHQSWNTALVLGELDYRPIETRLMQDGFEVDF